MLDLDISLSSWDVVTRNITNEMTKKDKPSPGVSCCVHHGAILTQLKATPCFFPPPPTTPAQTTPPHPLRKRPCQAQAQNNKAESRGGAWGRPLWICMQLFAVSMTTKTNQRAVNGVWQALPNASVVHYHHHCLPSSQDRLSQLPSGPWGRRRSVPLTDSKYWYALVHRLLVLKFSCEGCLWRSWVTEDKSLSLAGQPPPTKTLAGGTERTSVGHLMS